MENFNVLTYEQKKEILSTMLLIRASEEEIVSLNEQKALHGTNHLCIGQEASCLGLCHALDASDWLMATHRGHGFYLAHGGDINKMMAEMFGLKSGMCKGLGGSMHFSDFENHYVCSTGVVAGGVPIAVGMALELKYMKKDGIAVSIFGDGASNQGMALESLNLASFWQVPVLFYCENNGFAVSSRSEKFVANTFISRRAESFGIESDTVDGNDVEAVYNAVKKARDYIITNTKPFFLEVITYRMSGHSRSDSIVYRQRDEENLWREKCPVKNYAARLISEGVLTEYEINAMRDIAHKKAHEAAENCRERLTPENSLTLDEAVSLVYQEAED